MNARFWRVNVPVYFNLALLLTFSAPVQTGPEVHPASCTMGTGSFLGGKVRPGRDADPSPPSSAEVKNRVELYLYSP
jgi:hypothetical protein